MHFATASILNINVRFVPQHCRSQWFHYSGSECLLVSVVGKFNAKGAVSRNVICSVLSLGGFTSSPILSAYLRSYLVMASLTSPEDSPLIAMKSCR